MLRFMTIAFLKSYRRRFLAFPVPLAEIGSPKNLLLTLGAQSNFNIVIAKVVKLVKDNRSIGNFYCSLYNKD